MLMSALEYLERGFSVIPIAKGSKKPPKDFHWQKYQQHRATSEEVEEWFHQWPNAQLALVTGLLSQVAVIDADGPAGVQFLKKSVPRTSVYQKTKKGWHAFYHLTNAVSNKARSYPEIDVRGQGGYVLIAPSVHPSGIQYQLVFPEGFDGWDDLVEFPYTLFEIQETNGITLDPVDVGERNDTLAKIVGKYITKGLSFDEISNLCTGWNLSCIHPLGQQELETTIKSIFKTHFRNHPLDLDMDQAPLSSLSTLSNSKQSSHSLSSLSTLSTFSANDKQIQASTPQKPVSVTKNLPGVTTQNFQESIRQWILQQTGIIRTNDIDQEFALKTRKEKNNRSALLNYLKKQGKISKIVGKVGYWRILDRNLVRQNPLKAKAKNYKLPLFLDICSLVELYPKNIILVAGTPNSGKTTLALNFAYQLALLRVSAPKTIYNMSFSYGLDSKQSFLTPKGPVRYFNSEMDEIELSKRVSLFPNTDEWTPEIEFYERTSDFQDVIDPDGINIIDYLQVYENFWEVGVPIKEIWENLKTGIAIICLQKKPGAEFAKGGSVTLEIPRLVINLENNSPFGGIAKIVKAKAWATSENPNGLERDYKVVEGWDIKPVSEWRYVTEKERAKINKDYAFEKSQKKDYAYEFKLEDGSFAGLNYKDRQQWIDSFPNIDVDFELLNMEKDCKAHPFLTKKNWFFTVSGLLRKKNGKRTSQKTL